MEAIRFGALKSARVGIAIVAAAITVAAIPGEAAAKHYKHAHHHSHTPAMDAQASAAPQTPPMHYYGGPKSPMWRSAE